MFRDSCRLPEILTDMAVVVDGLRGFKFLVIIKMCAACSRVRQWSVIVERVCTW